MISNNLLERAEFFRDYVFERIVEKNEPVAGFLFKACDYQTLNNTPDLDDGFTSFDGYWGGKADSHAWFFKEIALPASDSLHRFELKIEFRHKPLTDAQYLVFVNGQIVKNVDNEHPSVRLQEGVNRVFIYAYSGMKNEEPMSFRASLNTVSLPAERLYYNLVTAVDSLKVSDKSGAEYFRILETVNHTCSLINTDNSVNGEFLNSVRSANEYIGSRLYDGALCNARVPTVSCVGHTHIDVAWLWTVRQAEEKALRSFSTVVYNMDLYPDYVFTSSQPFLYEAVKNKNPVLFSKIVKLAAEGRWQPEGSMWVEADCNITSGESLIRQIMFGKRFFREEFGVDNYLLWLPDAFGYSCALPQILVKSGIDLFITSKLSWNDTNTIPYDTFLWKGVDGTEILTYILTPQEYDKNEKECPRYTTYSGIGNCSYVKGTYERYQSKDLNANALLTYGFGDGGGGPNALDIENITRLGNGLCDVPKTKFEGVTEFFDRLRQTCRGNRRLNVWNGELYLEFHRGTLTSVAKNKKNNRKAEIALQNLEFLASAGWLLNEDYPHDALESIWKPVLTNQFHDILPGSAIREVYEQTDKDYEKIFADTAALTQKYLRSAQSRFKDGSGYFVFNGNSFSGDFTAECEGVFYDFKNIPAKGFALTLPQPVRNTVSINGNVMENGYFRIVFNADYEISGLYDKRNERELFKENRPGNVLRAYDDFPPSFYDAWDVRDYYEEKSRDITETVSVETVDKGAKKGLRIRKKLLGSTVCQTVYLYDSCDRIDFETDIDWHEKHRFLKALFPFDITASKATYDIQFGNVERSTTDGNSWDKAKFEVCAHKFADVSDGNFGVSVLNDCKYGYSFNGGVLGLSLLRCSSYPDESADEGLHSFTYSLYPHSGDCRHSGVYRRAFELNNPPLVVRLGNGKLSESSEFSLISCDCSGIIIETVKKAESQDALIVRCYEVNNSRVKAVFSVGFAFSEVFLCGTLENELVKLNHSDGKTEVCFNPFEIVTLKFIPQRVS